MKSKYHFSLQMLFQCKHNFKNGSKLQDEKNNKFT